MLNFKTVLKGLLLVGYTVNAVVFLSLVSGNLYLDAYGGALIYIVCGITFGIMTTLGIIFLVIRLIKINNRQK